jgi:hypothetical protein
LKCDGFAGLEEPGRDAMRKIGALARFDPMPPNKTFDVSGFNPLSTD